MMARATLQSRRAGERGYTAVEVLMAMTLFAIGAAGVIGMQRAVIQGGEDARRADMAMNIANTWIARLQRDSGFWTQPNATAPDKVDLNVTRWLKNVDTCSNLFCNIPIPAAPAAGLSPAFDSFGRDLPTGMTDAVYCVQHRLTWIVPPGVGPTYPNPMPTGLMRVEVRVYYARLEGTAIGNCATAAVPPEAVPAVSPYHFVYATTAIRENQLR